MYINNKGSMTTIFSGIIILASIVLSLLVSERFLILTGFLGMSMVISSMIGTNFLDRLWSPLKSRNPQK